MLNQTLFKAIAPRSDGRALQANCHIGAADIHRHKSKVISRGCFAIKNTRKKVNRSGIFDFFLI